MLRYPTSVFRNTVYGALRLYVWMAVSVLLLPVMRMLISPFICNVAIQNVTLQMVRQQVTYVHVIAPAAFSPVLPQASAIAMGRNQHCTGTPYFLLFAASVLLCLVYVPLLIRLVGVRADVTLLRFSRQFRSAVGWWREDDQFLALDAPYGLDHVLAVKNKVIALFYVVVLRIMLLAVAEALLRPALEFFFVVCFFGGAQAIITLRPIFHEPLANMALRCGNGILTFLAVVAWICAIWVRPTGSKGNGRDGFITAVVVLGVPGTGFAIAFSELLKAWLVRAALKAKQQIMASSATRLSSMAKLHSKSKRALLANVPKVEEEADDDILAMDAEPDAAEVKEPEEKKSAESPAQGRNGAGAAAAPSRSRAGNQHKTRK